MTNSHMEEDSDSPNRVWGIDENEMFHFIVLCTILVTSFFGLRTIDAMEGIPMFIRVFTNEVWAFPISGVIAALFSIMLSKFDAGWLLKKSFWPRAALIFVPVLAMGIQGVLLGL